MALPTGRSSRTERLGDVLASYAIGPVSYDPIQDAPLSDLLELPATDQLQVDVDRFNAALDAVDAVRGDESVEVPAGRPSMLVTQLRRATRRLAQGQRRDGLQAERPAGCWCLGLGGRGEVLVAYYHGSDSHGDPVPWMVRDAAGEPLSGFRIYCPCPDGSGLQFTNRQAQRQAEQEHRARQVATLWDGIGIPSRFADSTLASYLRLSPDNSPLVQQLTDWLYGDRWLVLYGLVGRGKTGLAAALARELVERGAGLLFRTVPDLLDRLKATYSGDGKESELLSALYAVDVLVLDDVGVDRSTDWTIERLFRILNHRYDERRRTILTTNLGPNELSQFLGSRNFDRLREMTSFVRVGGPNLRERRQELDL